MSIVISDRVKEILLEADQDILGLEGNYDVSSKYTHQELFEQVLSMALSRENLKSELHVLEEDNL